MKSLELLLLLLLLVRGNNLMSLNVELNGVNVGLKMTSHLGDFLPLINF